MNYLLLFLSSTFATLIAMFLVLKLFPQWNIMDNPKKYGLKRNPIPYSAGLIIFLVFTLHMLFGFSLTMQHVGMILGGTLITSVSFIDDRIGLSAPLRVFIHVLVGIVLVGFGIGITHFENPFGGTIFLNELVWHWDVFGQLITIEPISALFTIAWVFFVMNAVNLLDGIPGLVSGVGAIGSSTLFVLSLLLISSPLTTGAEKMAAEHIASLSIILAAILLTFNRFDHYPPKVIIGDTGAMFIGYMLAILSIFSGGKVATTLIVLGLPLTDMIWVIIRRISKGQSPMAADHNHYHHKLLRLGLTERQTLWTIYSVSILLGVTALALLYYFKSLGKFIAFALILLLIIATSVLLIKKEDPNTRGF